MATKTATRTAGSLTVGTAAIDRAKTTKAGENNRGPIYTVTVDGIEVGRIGKASASLWNYAGGSVFVTYRTKAEAVAAVVRRAVEAGTVADWDEVARSHAAAAALLAEVAEHETERNDEDNRDRARRAAGALALRPGVRDGDVVEYADGTRRRVVGVYGGRRPVVQVTGRTDGDGRVHLSVGGGTSYSGGCGPTVDPATLTEAGTVQGWAWIWHHGTPGGGAGVDVLVPFRLFRTTEETPSR